MFSPSYVNNIADVGVSVIGKHRIKKPSKIALLRGRFAPILLIWRKILKLHFLDTAGESPGLLFKKIGLRFSENTLGVLEVVFKAERRPIFSKSLVLGLSNWKKISHIFRLACLKFFCFMQKVYNKLFVINFFDYGKCMKNFILANRNFLFSHTLPRINLN